MKYTLFLLCLFLSLSSFSQQKNAKKKKKLDFALSTGLIWQDNLFGDINIIAGDVSLIKGKIPLIGIDGFRIGFETNFKSDRQFIIAPKFGYDFSIDFLSMRISAVNYFQNGKSEFRILPELGISIEGVINLTYGYGIRFNDANINGLSNHRLSLIINYNKRLWKAVFPKKRK
jgi:hypothetical protein